MIRFPPKPLCRRKPRVRPLFLALILTLVASGLYPDPFGDPKGDPSGGFLLDLPPGYRSRSAGGTSRSFQNPQGAVFELSWAIRAGEPEAYLRQVLSRLGIESEDAAEAFEYHGRPAALARLEFSLDRSGRPLTGNPRTGNLRTAPQDARRGWALCLDRGEDLLLALAYGAAEDQEILHLSCLDSIAPTRAEQYYWGPVTEYAWPRGELRETGLYNSGLTALIAQGDAEAAQGLVDREFLVLKRFERTPQWQEAWRRFYRMIRRDSWERLRDPLFRLERLWNTQALLNPDRDGERGAPAGLSDRELASRALAHVQSFRYERDLMGSDFVNLVSALTEGRGDCDSRALLWALFLAQANIPAGIMVSRDYGHAMGMAELPGPGARFPLGDKTYLVAETTAQVELGLIGQSVSETAKWLGVIFE
ncbi:MAG: hypothetical protein LBQ46_00625 [Treponema sp.]|jgi:hypothetical protein|nr:hypothetical protein [Treponema sp.]